MRINTLKPFRSTFSKVVFLLSAVNAGLLLIVLTLYFYMLQQEKEIFKSSNELYNNEIESLLKLNSESYTSIVADITYWDEFVTFTKTRDISWFNRSVANIIDTYKVQYLAAYSLDGNLITKVSTIKIKSKDFIPKEALKKLYEKKIDKFYLKIPEGIVEVYGATIHPSDDPFKNKSKPSGYFIMVRLLDENYFSNIEQVCSSKIKFYTGKETAYKTVFKIVSLKDYQGNTIAELYVKRAYDIDFYITKSILFIMALALIISWIVYYFYSVKWAKLPISLIRKILISEDKSAIHSLKNIKGEFRYIGKLFEENLAQRNLLHQAKEKAEESDKLKSAFLTNLSHEIRTPMNAVIGFSELLEDASISEQEKIEYRKIINKSGKNLITIIDDLIEMSRIDTKQVIPLYSDFDLNASVKNIFTVMQQSATTKNVEFSLVNNSPNFLKRIISDKTKVERILKNLLLNAIKFTDKGIIELRYEVDVAKALIHFAIRDTGIGIEESNIDIIFKRFRKVQNDHTIRGAGLGLGLAISKEYVAMLGGTLEVQSEIGVGSTFLCTIPLLIDEKAVNINSAMTDEESGNNVETILVAEDDRFNFLLIEKILALKNYKVIRAEDGEKAVALCLAHPEIDLVLMDIKMPKLDGYEAFKKIRAARPNLPIVAQTAYTSSEEVEKIFQLGFAAYLSKPISKEKLYILIDNMVNYRS